jgi:preprotein translocase subunit SecB
MEEENNYEVTLKVTATASLENETYFVAEVSYGGVFFLQGIPENELQPALLIFCPSLLFPYVRRIISDATRDGGYPSLLLDPIDFAKLYMERAQQAQQNQPQEETPQ